MAKPDPFIVALYEGWSDDAIPDSDHFSSFPDVQTIFDSSAARTPEKGIVTKPSSPARTGDDFTLN